MIYLSRLVSRSVYNIIGEADTCSKPIQRICKYPLLIAELLKYTPALDCPNSRMEIDGTLTRLREITAEINQATNDSRMKATLEKTWLLQDRLLFPNRVSVRMDSHQVGFTADYRLS